MCITGLIKKRHSALPINFTSDKLGISITSSNITLPCMQFQEYENIYTILAINEISFE